LQWHQHPGKPRRTGLMTDQQKKAQRPQALAGSKTSSKFLNAVGRASFATALHFAVQVLSKYAIRACCTAAPQSLLFLTAFKYRIEYEASNAFFALALLDSLQRMFLEPSLQHMECAQKHRWYLHALEGHPEHASARMRLLPAAANYSSVVNSPCDAILSTHFTKCAMTAHLAIIRAVQALNWTHLLKQPIGL
jgi:hypothetical protein